VIATSDNSPVNFAAIIKKLEELVLSSSGVDSFEEILKLIYAKLYEEKVHDREKKNYATKKIQLLFEGAKREWPGMFEKRDKIELSDAHLNLCKELLWKIPLYNTDLTIIDAAIEYLLPKGAKGSRGQYFTPRHIIDEIVKILNPRNDERIIDPACGSGGFLLHSLKWVKEREGVVSNNLYGVDYDSRMIKVANAMLLMAGVKKINLYTANSLSVLKDIKDGTLDMVCTNPPFGGEVRDREVLEQYSLTKNGRGKAKNLVERHILFIERIIRLLKPGGRAAIVVPQGVLNNINLDYVRNWLYGEARILGVIGMDVNTFKPFTNVKTSLLFLQKWKGKPLSDYPVFMAVSKRSGKNLSGNLMYKMKGGKQIIDSDLPEIGERLREFIRKESLNF